MFYITPATTAHIPIIRKMAEEVFPATYKRIISPAQMDYMMEWMYSEKNLQRQMEEEGCHYYIAYEECEAAGYLSLRQEDRDLFHLERLYVLPYFQKNHLGKQLFRKALEVIHELHPEPCEMELNVNRHNPAVEFYLHMGMQIRREGDFPIGNGYFMNDYIMGISVY